LIDNRIFHGTNRACTYYTITSPIRFLFHELEPWLSLSLALHRPRVTLAGWSGRVVAHHFFVRLRPYLSFSCFLSAVPRRIEYLYIIYIYIYIPIAGVITSTSIAFTSGGAIGSHNIKISGSARRHVCRTHALPRVPVHARTLSVLPKKIITICLGSHRVGRWDRPARRRSESRFAGPTDG